MVVGGRWSVVAAAMVVMVLLLLVRGERLTSRSFAIAHQEPKGRHTTTHITTQQTVAALPTASPS